MKKNIIGVMIFNKANWDCPFCNSSVKSDEFELCFNPQVIKENKITHQCIVKCSDEFENCRFYKNQNNNHLEFIEKYIEKYSEDGCINIPEKHWKYFTEKIEDDELYIHSLINYGGYFKVTNIHTEDGSRTFANKIIIPESSETHEIKENNTHS